MTDPVSVASAALRQARKAQEKFLVSNLVSNNAMEGIKRVGWDLEISLDRVEALQEIWYLQTQQSDLTSDALWGIQGWAKTLHMVDKIATASKEVENYLIEMRESQKPGLKWKSAMKSLLSKKRPDSELPRLAALLTKAVDQLWIYSDIRFESFHGVNSPGPRPPSIELLILSAVKSRAGSLQLYGYCAKSTLNCSLAMEFLDAEENSPTPAISSHPLIYVHKSTPKQLFYRLWTEVPGSRMQYQKMTVQMGLQSVLVRKESGDIVQSDPSNFQLFEPWTESTIIPIARLGSGSPSCLRISKEPFVKIPLESHPETLASVLNSTGDMAAKEHFSVRAKTDLAYKVAESALFLLGTPWFSSWSSRNFLRLKSADGQIHSFTLKIQTLEFDDLLDDDPTALAENSQLLKIGVLLMEIALNRTDFSSRIVRHENEMDMISLLAEVERAMGVQYYKATAFCLLHRQPQAQFQGPEKYSSLQFGKWETYLMGFLRDFHTQVFSRQVTCQNYMELLTYRRLEFLRELDRRPAFMPR